MSFEYFQLAKEKVGQCTSDLRDTFYKKKWSMYWKLDLISCLIIIFGLLLSDIEVSLYMNSDLVKDVINPDDPVEEHKLFYRMKGESE